MFFTYKIQNYEVLQYVLISQKTPGGGGNCIKVLVNFGNLTPGDTLNRDPSRIRYFFLVLLAIIFVFPGFLVEN